MPEPGSRLVFVAGAPRSGTTLLQNILDSHPQIVGAPEFRHVRHLMESRARLHRDIDAGSVDSFLSKEAVDLRFAQLIEGLLLPLAERAGCAIVSEKTPKNILVFTQILEVFPAARLIHVVRDPRGVVASLLRVGERIRESGGAQRSATASVQGAIGSTKQCLGAGFAAEAMGPQRVLTVRYEDLVADMEGETRRVCAHIGLEWHNQMLTPWNMEHVAETAITEATGNVWYTRAEFNRDLDPSRVTTWKDVLTGAQQARICNAFAGDRRLAELGYDLSVAPLARRDRTQAIVQEGVRIGVTRLTRVGRMRRLRSAAG